MKIWKINCTVFVNLVEIPTLHSKLRVFLVPIKNRKIYEKIISFKNSDKNEIHMISY